MVGWGAGSMLDLFGGAISMNHLISILTSVGVTFSIIIILKNTSVTEIKQLIRHLV